MDPKRQHDLLAQTIRPDAFGERLKDCLSFPLRAHAVEILQMNITRRCNLCCRHCHVEGAPDRTEDMSRDDMAACLNAARHPGIQTMDITGGSPEMHPDLEWLLTQAAGLKKRLIVRSNAVILMEPAYHRFLDIYPENRVEVVVSLPNLHRERTDRMRGQGSFERIVAALVELNARGYGRPGSGLILDLVHNPVGAFLPGPQPALETEYRTRLRRDFGIEFNRLYCITNCPVGRYLDFLKNSGNLTQYIELLKQSFNPATVDGIMCRTTLSVGVDGGLFDCDFNQILDLPVARGNPAHIRDFDYDDLSRREIVIRSHCFSCTAGSGSSCQGTLE